jgi:hypothetical protein
MRLSGCLHKLNDYKTAIDYQRQAESMLSDLKHRA